jgi:GNAT superfamily N-acetyltransferase/5-hydroxyisourate hydrolase-like protein (transthyretin family)
MPMTIRTATENDLPAMLNVLQASLGSLDGMRTVDYWQWKHLDNPFGKSPVLLAFDGDRLIGLRAFMAWHFRHKGERIQAYRAVDTATHPDYQGKGIFTRLTMALLEALQSGLPSLIFNTPNRKSMPGYIKMGWKEAGKTRLRVKVFPLNMLMNRISKPISTHNAPVVFTTTTDGIVKAWATAQHHLVITDYSLAYLTWRYASVPGFTYAMETVEEGSNACVLLYRIKEGRLRELRITDIFYSGPAPRKVVRIALDRVAQKQRPDVVTVLTDAKGRLDALLPVGFFAADKKGLTITCRKVNSEALEALALNQDEWFFSAGTLELF